MIYQKVAKISHIPIFVWTKEKQICWDDNKFSIKTKSGFMLGSKAQDIYTAIIKELCNSGQNEIKINTRQILVEIGWCNNSYTKAKKGIEELRKTQYIFQNCLIDGEIIETKLLEIEAKGKGKNAFYVVSLPAVFADLPKFPFDYGQYLSFPAGIARRAYEIIKKNDRLKIMEIGLEKIALWLGARTKKTSDKRKTISSALDKIQAAGLIASYDYNPTKKQYKIIYPHAQKRQKPTSPKPPRQQQQPQTTPAPTQQNQELQDLCKLAKEPVSAVIAQYYRQKGAEYVKRNILYANDKANGNYGGFLRCALRDNYGKEYITEEEQAQRAKHIEEINAKNRPVPEEIEKRANAAKKREEEIYKLKKVVAANTCIATWERHVGEELNKGKFQHKTRAIVAYIKEIAGDNGIDTSQYNTLELSNIGKVIKLAILEKKKSERTARIAARSQEPQQKAIAAKRKLSNILHLEKQIIEAIAADGVTPYQTIFAFAAEEGRGDKTATMKNFVGRLCAAFAIDYDSDLLQYQTGVNICRVLGKKGLLDANI